MARPLMCTGTAGSMGNTRSDMVGETCTNQCLLNSVVVCKLSTIETVHLTSLTELKKERGSVLEKVTASLNFKKRPPGAGCEGRKQEEAHEWPLILQTEGAKALKWAIGEG